MRRFPLAVLALLWSCSSPETSFDFQNDSEIALKDKPLHLTRSQIGEGKYPLLRTKDGQEVPAQLVDRDLDGSWDELFFVSDFSAGERKSFTVKWVDEAPKYEARTSVRFGVRDALEAKVEPRLKDTFYPHELPGVNGYQPYQTDGPSWENDRVGFRHYLDGRNSKDVFGKKVSTMSPDNVGINEEGVTEDNYHVMEAWGRDILSVGNSLGIGGVSLEIGGSRLRRLGIVEGDPRGNVDSTHFSILDEGPVYSRILFDYQGWKPLDENRSYDLTETVEIWPGFHGYKNTVNLVNPKGDEVAVVGLVNSRTEKSLKVIYENEDWIVMGTHDKQTYEKEWYLGLALVLPKSTYLNTIKAPEKGRISTAFLARMKVDKPFSYFAMACWELRDPGFAKEEYFEKYLKDFTEQLTLKIKQ